jgi:hypothetical protein
MADHGDSNDIEIAPAGHEHVRQPSVAAIVRLAR